MNTKDWLQQKYQNLCKDYGHAIYRRDQHDKVAKSLAVEIEELNRMSDEAIALEEHFIKTAKEQIEQNQDNEPQKQHKDNSATDNKSDPSVN